MSSPRFAPAGLLIRAPRGYGTPIRLAVDGGGAADPQGPLDAWLVTDEYAELMPAIRRHARPLGVEPADNRFADGALVVRPRRVEHTSHPTYAYEIHWRGRRVVWAPEVWKLPGWVAGADLLFADAAGWSRPIPFRGGAGGHVAALDVAERARALGVRQLVFAHVGRPTIRAMDRGLAPTFGTIGRDGQSFRVPPRRQRSDRTIGS